MPNGSQIVGVPMRPSVLLLAGTIPSATYDFAPARRRARSSANDQPRSRYVPKTLAPCVCNVTYSTSVGTYRTRMLALFASFYCEWISAALNRAREWLASPPIYCLWITASARAARGDADAHRLHN